jgi:hypothetical protein
MIFRSIILGNNFFVERNKFFENTIASPKAFCYIKSV